MGLLFKAVINKGKTFDEIIKFNPFHDRLGRFTSGGNATFVTIRTKDPKKQHMADMAIARQKNSNSTAQKISMVDGCSTVEEVQKLMDKNEWLVGIGMLTRQAKKALNWMV